MNRQQLERAWDVDEPSSGFAERVLSRVSAEGSPRTSSLPPHSGLVATDSVRQSSPARPVNSRVKWRVAFGLVAVAAGLALSVHLGWLGKVAQGEKVAVVRTTIALGERTVAVLEPKASVTWLNRDVTQKSGDVFYRVEPSFRSFAVTTPFGKVLVLGTCFRVSIGQGERAGAVVTVYEGKTRLVQGNSSVELSAGEVGTLSSNGARRGAPSLTAGRAALPSLKDAQPGKSAAALSDPRARDLAALQAEKKDLEAQLAVLEGELSKTGPRGDRDDFDLDQNDWKALAERGAIKFRVPCLPGVGESWQPGEKLLDSLGLSPEDGATLATAYRHSNERVWAVLRPLCQAALGNSDAADAMDGMACISVIHAVGKKRDLLAVQEAFLEVAEVRAGLRSLAQVRQAQNPVFQMFMAITGEASQFQAELAESFGPDEAKRLAWGPGCRHSLRLSAK